MLFSLKWHVCVDGYHLEERSGQREPQIVPRSNRERLKTANLRGTVLAQPADKIVIVPKSNRWFDSEPMLVPGLFKQFADCDVSPEGTLDFVQRHGFLHKPKAKEETICFVENGKPLGGYSESIGVMRWLVEQSDAGEWELIHDWLDTMPQSEAGGGLGRLGLALQLKEGERPQFQLRAGSLWAALFVQALQEMTLGVKYGKCKRPGCPKYFRIGRPEGRREGAEYCSSTCQKSHAYSKTKGETNERR